MCIASLELSDSELRLKRSDTGNQSKSNVWTKKNVSLGDCCSVLIALLLLSMLVVDLAKMEIWLPQRCTKLER